MKWPLMTSEELHAFGIDAILPYLEKEGVTIESVSKDIKINPQIVGKRWGSRAFIYVRTACYPSKGDLTPNEFDQLLAWADKHGATAFFAGVGIVCINYPDRSEVTTEEDMRLPIRHAGFRIAYPGLEVMNTSDRVRIGIDSDSDTSDFDITKFYERRGVTDALVTDYDAARVFAIAWNQLDFSALEPHLDDSVRYSSQQVLDELVGKDAVVEYIAGKMETIKAAAPQSQVYAESGKTISNPPRRPCVIMAQGARDNLVGLVLFEVRDGRIHRIDFCTVLPDPRSAYRSGEYPV